MTGTALARAALAYAQLGARVFPCAARGKRPCTANGLHDATCELETVHGWWSRWPNANVGVVTGSTFDVLDLDDGNAISWARAQGIPAGPAVQTARGLHVYVQPVGVGCRTRLREHVDYRGRGGYVVVPPSIHPTGRVYRWIGRDVPVAPAPPWLRELLSEHAAAPGPRAPGPWSRSDVQLSRRGLASLRAMAAKLARAPIGERNDLLFWCAVRAADTGATQDDVAVVLSEAAERAGLDNREVRRTLQSAFGKWGE